MGKQRELNDEAFKTLLAWLDADRERAGEKYQHIHQALIQILVWRGCIDAEAWADEVVDRVVEKLPELVTGYKGDPALYFYGVAKRAANECRRQQLKSEPIESVPNLPAPDAADEAEAETPPSPLSECTAECMASLKRAERKLLLGYYRWRGQKKIDAHRDLAAKLGLKRGALRVKVHRARAKLDKCIFECMKRAGADETVWWRNT